MRAIYERYWWTNRKISYLALLVQIALITVVGLGFAWLISSPAVNIDLEERFLGFLVVPIILGLYFICAHSLLVRRIRRSGHHARKIAPWIGSLPK